MASTPTIAVSPRRWPVVFDYSFRILFLLGTGWAVVGLAPWLVYYLSDWRPALVLAAHLWHGHEMVFGFAGAMAGGFLLTATPNWTGTPPRRGAYLAGVALLWGVARIAGVVGHPLAPWLAAGADLAWLAAVAWAAGGPLWRFGVAVHRVFPPLVLGVYWAADLLVHLEAVGLTLDTARLGLYLGVDALVMLMAAIGGRLLPRFTAMAMQGRGLSYQPPASTHLVEAVLFTALLAMTVGDGWWLVTQNHSELLGGAALLAALATAVRLWQWRPDQVWRIPLVVILHLGFAWLAVGLALRGVAALTDWVLPSTAVHAITVGAMGSLMVGVMTRVVLSHTGRPPRPPRIMLAVFVLVPLAGLLRAVVALWWPALGIVGGGLLWLAAFGLALAFVWPLLLRPRPDGLPG